MIMDDIHFDSEKFNKEASDAKWNVHIPTLDELVDPEEEKKAERTRIISTVMGVVAGTIAAVLIGNRKQK